MMLSEALTADKARIIAFVGGGGKTSLMYRVAKELASRGERVVVTTTTHIMAPGKNQAQSLILSEAIEEILQQLRHRLQSQNLVAVGSRIVSPDGKMKGIPPEWVEEIAKLSPSTHIVIEADGSAGRPFKAPADHEPVIPAITELVVPVVGIDVIDKPFSSDFVHRPERVAAIVDIAYGEPITPELVAKVMLDPKGPAKGSPSNARIVPVINKVDDRLLLETARNIGRLMLDEGANRLVIARAKFEPAVWEVMVRK